MKSEQSENEQRTCNQSEMDEKMKETNTNGHTKERNDNDSLAGSSSKNGLSGNIDDNNGLQDRNGKDIVDVKQNGFKNETATNKVDNGGETNSMEQDKGR